MTPPGRKAWSWVVKITTVTLQCGHTRVYRGDYVPKLRARCKTCPPEPVQLKIAFPKPAFEGGYVC